MREFFGAGWRMYYFHQDPLIIVMLNGGGKKSQAKDIKLAKALIMELGEINEIIKKD
jgi:putative addiction module killer protein